MRTEHIDVADMIDVGDNKKIIVGQDGKAKLVELVDRYSFKPIEHPPMELVEIPMPYGTINMHVPRG